MEFKPIVGITLGDAAGIGPEITIKALAEPALRERCIPLVIGDPRIVRAAIDLTGTGLRVREISRPADCRGEEGVAEVLPAGPVNPEERVYGRVSPALGEASVLQSREAARLALGGETDAVCSAPVNKEAMREAGYHYEGQTQLFGEYCGAEKWGMLLIFGAVRCYMLTNHLSLADAIRKVTKDRILDALELIAGSMDLFVPDRKPVVAVSALNPHGGENGMFGREEIEQIGPAVEEAKKRFTRIVTEGPVPSDTVFVRAREGEFDAVVSLFHDQANMAMKLLGFGEMVTYILGLPIIRTSVGHGTAFDIAGRNKADHKNLYAAIIAASRLAKIKKENRG